MQKSKTKSILLEYIILAFAAFMMAFGIYVFKFPNNFSFGGVTGISIILAKYTPLSPSTYSFILNMTLLIIGFIFMGRGFAFKTVYISTLFSVALVVLEHIWVIDEPITNQPVLELAFGIFLPGAASAIMFNMNASSGGTDIIAMILRKYTSLDIATALFCVDCIIVLSTFFVFGVTTALFNVCGLIIRTFVIDGVIENINACKYFNIICSNPKPICDFICNKLQRDATIYDAVGAFTKNEKHIILAAMRRREAVELRRFIKSVDPEAFILISTTSEIIGKGFRGVD